jgi:hypothetical protein
MLRRMRLLSLTVTVAVLALGFSAVEARPSTRGTTRHCGSFKYGTDGRQPGPGGITAKNVTCWFARAVALLGAAPGWHCTLETGVRFVCRGATGVVTFYGE